MNLTENNKMLLSAIEDEMREIINLSNIPEDESLYSMLSYHLGWSGHGAGELAQGKRIRPLILLQGIVIRKPLDQFQ
jgi:geranylgeranyl pyrophosphate synthase